jgi:hypothetical protein
MANDGICCVLATEKALKVSRCRDSGWEMMLYQGIWVGRGKRRWSRGLFAWGDLPDVKEVFFYAIANKHFIVSYGKPSCGGAGNA